MSGIHNPETQTDTQKGEENLQKKRRKEETIDRSVDDDHRCRLKLLMLRS